jgi:hypothetical protein
VAAVCHGLVTNEQVEGLRELLHGEPMARDQYLHRVAVHAYLASEPDLFAGPAIDADGNPEARELIQVPLSEWGKRTPGRRVIPGWLRMAALAAGIMVVLGTAWWLGIGRGGHRQGETSRAVAMLNRVVNAQWNGAVRFPKLGAPLEPGRLVLDSGLAQIVFYNGARVVIEGPAELRLVSSTEAFCVRGTLTAEVPPQAKGFRIITPRLEVTDLGTAFGLKATRDRSELHVFEGRVEFRAEKGAASQDLTEGKGTVVEGAGAPKTIAADRAGFADLFELQTKSVAAEARRYDQWRASIRQLQRDPALWVHLDFEHGGAPAWRLANSGSRATRRPMRPLLAVNGGKGAGRTSRPWNLVESVIACD